MSWLEPPEALAEDMMLAFPYVPLALMVIAILRPGLLPSVAAIGIVYIPQFARLVRASTLVVKEAEYVDAAKAVGASTMRLLLRHVLPQIVPIILVQATLVFGTAIIEVAGLGFLGLGAQPPTAEWGAMLSDGRAYILRAWWLSTFPGLAIMLSVLGLNLLGDALRDSLDPKMRGIV